MISQNRTQPANAGAIRGFCEHRLRIESGDKGLRADGVSHKAGGDANGAIGPEVDARSRQCGDADRDGDDGTFSQVHTLPDGTNTGKSLTRRLRRTHRGQRLHGATQQRGQRRPCATERHVQQLDAGAGGEHFHRDMQRADAATPLGQVAHTETP